MTDSESMQPSEPTLDAQPARNPSSRRAILTLIICALFISGIALYRGTQRKPNITEKITPATLKDTELFFSPVKPVRHGERVSFPIHIRTGANTVSAVELHIRYDPKLLTNVTIEPGKFFPNPTILAQSVNADSGEALLIIGTLSPRMGEGEIATIEATTITSASSSTITLIFDPGTKVAALGETTNVVKSTANQTISIGP